MKSRPQRDEPKIGLKSSLEQDLNVVRLNSDGGVQYH